MTKREYLEELRKLIAAFPSDEIDRTLEFYTEAIEDRIESGSSEEAAVADLEAPACVAARLMDELPIVPRMAARFESLKLTGIPLIIVISAAILGSPIWLTLVAAGFGIVLAAFLVLGSVLVSCWTITLALLIALPICLIDAIATSVAGSLPGTVAALGMGLISGGVSLICLHLCFVISGFIAQLMSQLGHKVYSVFAHKTQVGVRRRAPIKTAWHLVHRIALIMTILGCVLAFVAWGLSNFDGMRLANEINRGNEVIGQWFAVR